VAASAARITELRLTGVIVGGETGRHERLPAVRRNELAALGLTGVATVAAGILLYADAPALVENVTGIVLAAKGKSDLAISVVKNSVARIAAFLFPALILVSLMFSAHLTFELEPIYIGALLLTALVVWQVTGDGETYPYEGWALIALCVILATFAWYE
jgi:Ca2+:H+ antiporter